MIETLNRDFMQSTILLVIVVGIIIGIIVIQYCYANKSIKIRKRYSKDFYMNIALIEYLSPSRRRYFLKVLDIDNISFLPDGIHIQKDEYLYTITQITNRFGRSPSGGILVKVYYGYNISMQPISTFFIENGSDNYVHNIVHGAFIKKLMKALYENLNSTRKGYNKYGKCRN